MYSIHAYIIHTYYVQKCNVPVHETNFMRGLNNNVIYNYNFDGGKIAMHDLFSLYV